MEDTLVEQLEMQQRQVEYCASITLPSIELAPLLDLAGRVAGTYNSLVIKRLQRGLKARDVTLTGDEIRMILDLALHALAENKPGRHYLKVVPPAKRV
jgi:hypothetical protein